VRSGFCEQRHHDGGEDALLSLDVQEFWQELDMPRLRAKILVEVAAAVRDGEVTSFADYQTLLEPYDNHPAMVEGQEAFRFRVVDEDDDLDDASGDDGDVDDNNAGGEDDDGDAPPSSPAP
jgi:hypothetical protein